MKINQALIALLLVLGLSGCWESADVTFYEPGVYQGAADNHESNAAALEERFQRTADR